MKLAIVAYPNFDEGDRQWIESFRAKHDPQAPWIGVHFTLVFPVEAVPSELEPDIVAAAGSTEPISVVVRETRVVRDVRTLRPHLRSDIPFVPHMTVGAAPDLERAARLAEELGARARTVRGTVEHIELVSVDTRHVQTIATYALGTAAHCAG